MGDVPDGIYTVLGSTVDYLASGPNAASTMQRVIEVLRTAQERHASTSETIAALRVEIPDAPAGLWEFLDSSKGRGITTLIMILIAVLTAALPYVVPDEPGIAPSDVERIVETSVTKAVTKVPAAPQRSVPVEAVRPKSSPDESIAARRKADQTRKKKRSNARHARRRNR